MTIWGPKTPSQSQPGTIPRAVLPVELPTIQIDGNTHRIPDTRAVIQPGVRLGKRGANAPINNLQRAQHPVLQ